MVISDSGSFSCYDSDINGHSACSIVWLHEYSVMRLMVKFTNDQSTE